MRLVFDTNVLLSATLWDGSVAQKLLFKCISSDFDIFSSEQILDEYQKVLKRDFEYSDGEIENIMQKVLSFVKIVQAEEKLDIVKEDPDDNKIIECAIASNSDYLATYDKHLLNIKEFRGIKILPPEGVMLKFN